MDIAKYFVQTDIVRFQEKSPAQQKRASEEFSARLAGSEGPGNWHSGILEFWVVELNCTFPAFHAPTAPHAGQDTADAACCSASATCTWTDTPDPSLGFVS